MSERSIITPKEVLTALLQEREIQKPLDYNDGDWHPQIGEDLGRVLYVAFDNGVHPKFPDLPTEPQLGICIDNLHKEYDQVYGHSDTSEYGEWNLLMIDTYLAELCSTQNEKLIEQTNEYHNAVKRGFGYVALEKGEFKLGLLFLQRGTPGGITDDPLVCARVRKVMGERPFMQRAFSSYIAEQMNLAKHG